MAVRPVAVLLQAQIVLCDWMAGGALLDDGAAVELGSGPTPEVLERTQRFARTLGEVVAQFQRKPEMLAYADLRHSSGYALRLRGVSTVSAEQAARLAAKRR